MHKSRRTGGDEGDIRQPVRRRYALRTATLAILLLPIIGRPELQPASEIPLRFSEHLIMSGYGYAFGLAAADLDQDGDLDLTSGDAERRCMYWFENDRKGGFRRHFVQAPSPHERWLERHAIGDLNLDGTPDVAGVDNVNGRLLWFENSGKPASGEWKQHVITDDLPKAYDVALVDLDKDGDLDAAASSWMGNAVAWFENPFGRRAGETTSRGAEPWTRHMIDAGIPESRTIRVADFDRDGYSDLLATGTGSNLVVWYQHPGRDPRQSWRRHVIDDTMFRPTHGHPVDMDGDGDSDVVMAGGSSDPARGAVAWYENNGKPAAGKWPRHTIAEILPTASEAVAADLDGDGTVEVAVTRWGSQGGLYLFKPGKDPRRPWARQVLKDRWIKASQVLIADLDGDGRQDIVAEAERGSNECRWWRNLGRKAK